MDNEIQFLRDIVGTYMVELGKRDERVVVVNADLANTCRTTQFASLFPNRSFNVGIAEQNMVSFAAGLAHEGFIPYVFSMAPFISMRACEQCRTDIAYGNKNVRLVGIYSGVSGGISGVTHWAVEDCGIMTSIPEMNVIELSDANLAKAVMEYSLKFNGPLYIRCSISPANTIHTEKLDIHLGGSLCVRDGIDVAILCSGSLVQNALEAAAILKDVHSIDTKVVDMYSIKPIDEQAIIDASKTGCIVVVQDHNIYGGLGSMVASIIAHNNLNTKFKTIGFPDHFVTMAHTNALYEKLGLSVNGIVNSILELM